MITVVKYAGDYEETENEFDADYWEVQPDRTLSVININEDGLHQSLVQFNSESWDYVFHGE